MLGARRSAFDCSAGAPQATSCCLIQSRRASSIRVCQARPPARKWSMTYGDNRMVVGTFGRALGGRPPRRTGALANFSGQPSFERSGAVSGSKPRAVEPSFSIIGPPHPFGIPTAVWKMHGNPSHVIFLALPIHADGRTRTRRRWPPSTPTAEPRPATTPTKSRSRTR